MRMIAYKTDRKGLISGIFVRTYYVDDAKPKALRF